MSKLLFLLTIFAVYTTGQTSFYSYENSKKFADYLFETSDYLRAIDEYERCNQLHFADTTLFKIGYCFCKIGNFEKAKEKFFTLFNSPLTDLSKINYSKCNFFLGNYKEVIDFSKFNIKNSDILRNELNKLAFISFIKMKSKIDFDEKWIDAFEEQPREFMKSFLKRKLEPEYKDPLIAGMLSAIIPGAGKIYTKRYEDGITAFLLTGLFSYLSYDNFHAKHNFRGWLFAGLALGFYSGNIYGAASSAQIYNAYEELKMQDEFDDYIKLNNYFLSKEEDNICK